MKHSSTKKNEPSGRNQTKTIIYVHRPLKTPRSLLMTVFGIRHTYPLLTTTETHLKLKCPEATDGFVYADKRILKEQDHKIITHFWGICKFFRFFETHGSKWLCIVY